MVKGSPVYKKIIVLIIKSNCHQIFFWAKSEGGPLKKRVKIPHFLPQNWDKIVIPAQNIDSGRVKVSFSRAYHWGAYLEPIWRMIKSDFQFFLF